MSLQVNLSSKEISQAYQDIVNANNIDWLILTYEKGSNDLKVQATGDGGLEELEEEFSDGRYVFTSLEVLSLFSTVRSEFNMRLFEWPIPTWARNHDAAALLLTSAIMQSKLAKFVQINWCGDGVPESKKGLFHTHSSTVANFLRGSHVVISARNEVCHLSPWLS
jgi:drebrin-like protein